MPNKLSYKTEMLIILVTGFFNFSIGLFIVYIGINNIANNEWYKIFHIFLGFLIMSYPFFHYIDRRKEKAVHLPTG